MCVLSSIVSNRRRFASHHLRWIARLSWHSYHCPVAWVSFGRSGSYSRAGPKPWSRAVSTVLSSKNNIIDIYIFSRILHRQMDAYQRESPG